MGKHRKKKERQWTNTCVGLNNPAGITLQAETDITAEGGTPVPLGDPPVCGEPTHKTLSCQDRVVGVLIATSAHFSARKGTNNFFQSHLAKRIKEAEEIGEGRHHQWKKIYIYMKHLNMHVKKMYNCVHYQDGCYFQAGSKLVVTALLQLGVFTGRHCKQLCTLRCYEQSFNPVTHTPPREAAVHGIPVCVCSHGLSTIQLS